MLHLYNSLGKAVATLPSGQSGMCHHFYLRSFDLSACPHRQTSGPSSLKTSWCATCVSPGYQVKRGMNFTDIEDKAVAEAEKEQLSVGELTERNIQGFLREMRLLGMLKPDYLPRASRAIPETVRLIEQLLQQGAAYRHGCDIYFDPLTYAGFGRIYGLDMSKWPKTRRRFARDTYPRHALEPRRFYSLARLHVSTRTPTGGRGWEPAVRPGISRTPFSSAGIFRRPCRSIAAASTTWCAITITHAPSLNLRAPTPWPGTGCTANIWWLEERKCQRAGATSCIPMTC